MKRLPDGEHWTLDNAETETVACPLCGGMRFATLCATDRYDMNIRTVGCEGCGLVFTNPQPTAKALDDFYERHYRRYYQKTDVPNLEYIRKYRKDERAAYTAEYLVRAGAIARAGRVLDIGASEGCILKALRDRSPELQCAAVEPNPEFGAFASQYAGCSVVSDLSELRPNRERFDLIILNHVFEHLKDPTSYLRSLAAYLSPAGRIYIDVPDLLAYTGLESLHIAHLYHFSQRTLRATATLAGYAVLAMEPHAPVMHPKSIRSLMAPQQRAPASDLAPVDLAPVPEGWDIVQQIAGQAWRYHRRRWPLHRRLRGRIESWFGIQ